MQWAQKDTRCHAIDLNVYFRLKGNENARIRGNPYKIGVNQYRLNVRILNTF